MVKTGYRWKLKIHDGYVCKAAVDKGKTIFRDWWTAKKETTINIHSIPKEYWGKRIKVKIEIDDTIKEE